jgi:hypothetical protein
MSQAIVCVGFLLQVTYLTIADFSMREELVLKIAILAEKFAPSVEVGALCRHCGSLCSLPCSQTPYQPPVAHRACTHNGEDRGNAVVQLMYSPMVLALLLAVVC